MWYDFQYKDGEYYCEDVPIKKVAEEVGTPVYIYSYSALQGDFDVFREAFEGIDHLICYSVKANANLAVLKTYASMGTGFDVVSGGELFKVLKAGGDPQKVVFSGVGKMGEEMKAGIKAGILFFNVESREELYLLDEVARSMGEKARVSLRVNPDIDPKTHPYISTGLKNSKFGISFESAPEVYKEAAGLDGIEVVGIQTHIGSQILEVSPFLEATKKLVDLAEKLKGEGISIKYIDIGGGLGISYGAEENTPHPKEYAEVVKKEIEGLPYTLVLEPGRSIVAGTGILVTKVLYVKEGASKKFVVVDAAMNDLIRPAFYDSYHEILPADEKFGGEEIVDVVGPVCESGDFFARDRAIPGVERGELLVILTTGAYGFVMASNYNARPRVPEVLVAGEDFTVVRERESYEDLIRGETIPGFLEVM